VVQLVQSAQNFNFITNGNNMNTWKSEFITINNYKIHVKQTGGDLPAIFLLHGFSDSGRYWSRLAADLAPTFNVFMPDMVGHGLSAPLDGVISIIDYGEIVMALLDHYGVDTVGVGGHSMGGVLAAVVAASYPQRFTAVMLEDPAWRDAPVSSPEFIGASPVGPDWRQSTVAMRQMPVEEALAMVSAERPSWHPTDLEAYLHDRLQFDMAIFDQLDFSIRQHWREQLGQIQCPLLLVTGEAERGGIIHPEFAQTILGLAHDGHLAQILGAGHGIHREQYEAFRDAVVPFFEQYAA
jgi:pimeloyl-ACP methyl ester carboxylesterase